MDAAVATGKTVVEQDKTALPGGHRPLGNVNSIAYFSDD